MNDFFHILNPSPFRRKAVWTYFNEHTHLPHIWIDRLSHPKHLETVVEWALKEERPNIAVWGGDGTLSRTVQTIFEWDAFEKMLVALVPAGTCNDFARKLGLPHWRRYAKHIPQESFLEQRVDVGILETFQKKRVFVNNAGFGRTYVASRKRSNPISDIFSFQPKRLDLDWEINGSHQFETRDALLGVICNGPFFSKGLAFEKYCDVHDGLLNAFFESPQSRLNLLFKFFRGRFGYSLTSKSTFRMVVQKLVIESGANLFAQVDGEPLGEDPVKSLTFSVLPLKLRLALWR